MSSTLVAFGAAMVPILFTYGGWQSANYVGEEIANPKRNLPLALVAGTVAVVVIYITVNVVYLRALGLNGLAATPPRPPTRRAGCSAPSGDLFVSGAIAISTFGFLDLSILAPTRVYYAMAADRLFVPALATLHPRFGTPSLAIIVQSTWSCVLALTGTYDQLAELRRLRRLDFLRPHRADRADLPPEAAAVAAPLRRLPRARLSGGADPVRDHRRRRRRQRRSARAPAAAAKGAALIALGVPVYFWFARTRGAGG